VAAVGANEPLKFHLENAPLVLENVARSIQLTSNGKSHITARGKRFTILQAHFSTPSGHLVDGVPSAMELSLTAKAADNQMLVLSVLVNEGEENAAVAEFADSLPRAKISVDLQKPFDLARLLPKTAAEGYYHYSGSLAAPPCSENVERYVLQEPIEISTAQLVRFQALLGHNARPTQLLYGRKVTMPESGFVASGKDELKIKSLADQAKTAATNDKDQTTNN
jgi:carbonic anhydrase